MASGYATTPLRKKSLLSMILFVGVICLHGLTPLSQADDHGLYYDGPLFDAHAHYIPRKIGQKKLLSVLDRSGIQRAVMFADADEVLSLATASQGRVIPFLDTFRKARGRMKTELTASDIDEAEAALLRGGFAGVGELVLRIHPMKGLAPNGIDIPVDSPPVLRLLDLVAKHGIPVNLHVDSPYASELERALMHNPNATVIWAHAGYGKPSLISGMLERNPNLYADLSIVIDPDKGRGSSIFRGNTLDPQWQALLTRYSHRLMFGSDMAWRRYDKTPKVVETYRRILGRLPRQAAENIGYRTAAKLLDIEGI